MTTSPLADVRSLFEAQTNAVLCSAHAGLGGWPYGSAVPYAILPTGDLAVLLSDIAEHTKNLLRDARGTIFLADPAAHEQPQAGARHAMLVRARRPDGEEEAAAEACYFRRFPGAERMRGAHGFAVWVLEVESVRWIAGFGAMGWIDRSAWCGQPDPLQDIAAGVIAHLDADHADAMLLLAQTVAADVVQASATGVDRGGLALLAQDAAGRTQRLRLPFASVAANAEDVRAQVIRLVQQARARRAGA